jgi:hypothetical protein
MASSIAMIDYHYGQLAHDSREHAVSLLDALAVERAVDARWTAPGKRANPLAATFQAGSEAITAHRGARWTSRRQLVVSAVNERS